MLYIYTSLKCHVNPCAYIKGRYTNATDTDKHVAQHDFREEILMSLWGRDLMFIFLPQTTHLIRENVLACIYYAGKLEKVFLLHVNLFKIFFLTPCGELKSRQPCCWTKFSRTNDESYSYRRSRLTAQEMGRKIVRKFDVRWIRCSSCKRDRTNIEFVS